VAAGHAWSLFARFRGGKALAVTMGMLLPHYLLAGVIGVLIIITLSLLLSEKELAAIISVFLLVPLTALTGWWQQLAVQQWLPFCVALLLVALIVTRKYLTASARTAPVPPPSAAA
jgi:glycerol-3-phosphate acyltransferase PlsY